jgi:pimeloyl-ACP methyl ester carboxylesterase
MSLGLKKAADMKLVKGLALLASLYVLISGCTPNQMYRPTSVEVEGDYTLSYIEFDDQGEPWSPVQAQQTLALIERANARPEGCVVIVFVHGWNNNDSAEQEQTVGKSLYGFKEMMTLVADQVKENNPTSTPALIGVFIAWRGQSSYSFLKPFTFWGRQRAAKRIASPATTGTLFRLMSATKENPNSRIVLIGHSFGGLIVEGTVIDVAAGLLLGSTRSEFHFPADLVVLVNPASASVEAKEFVDLLAREGVRLYRIDAQGKRYERPLMVSVTSESDTATRVLFPAGQTFTTIGQRFRAYGPEFCTPATSQRRYLLYTAGNNPVLYSNRVIAEPLPAGAAANELDLRTGTDPLTKGLTIAFNGQRQRFVIEKLPGAFNDTPYWIMRVPKSLIPDHFDIFNVSTIRLLQALTRATGALAPVSHTVLVRETTVQPLGLTVRPSGELLFVDQLRRIYSVPAGSTEPQFVACLPGDVNPASAMGSFSDAESTTWIETSEELSKHEGKRIFSTVLLRLKYDLSEPVKAAPVKSTLQFLAGTADPENHTLYLVTKDGLYAADLSKRRPRPAQIAKIDTSDNLGWMRFDPQGTRLLLPDSGRGALYIVDLASGSPHMHLAANGLGWPADVGIDPKTGELYVADSKGAQIWRFRCQDEQCTAPQVFARAPGFGAPARLSVGSDGTVWVADPQARKIFALGPHGNVEKTIASLGRRRE